MMKSLDHCSRFHLSILNLKIVPFQRYFQIVPLYSSSHITVREGPEEKRKHFDTWHVFYYINKIVFADVQTDPSPLITKSVIINENLWVSIFIGKISLKKLDNFNFPLRINGINILEIQKKLEYVNDSDIICQQTSFHYLLMMDEIHPKSYFDYTGGNIDAGHNSKQLDTSAYVFMAQSLSSRYRDVHILPIHKITAEDLFSCLKKIIFSLEEIGCKNNKRAILLFGSSEKACNYDPKNTRYCKQRQLHQLDFEVGAIGDVRSSGIIGKMVVIYLNFLERPMLMPLLK
ncbi:uncharacterized protein LOC111636795 [Centruroides sculpturatus]|uniref:uncharacterized protein LOC111636795 n=1 Tax=Centruroides sculpturatus TaxID=218467 RepID=UPI000C6CFB66|nr:uncharacterized protein LOC111636795 [Centruroides sculpturatus]